MRAVVLRSYGEPLQLGIEDIAPPALLPGHVRLRVHAVGLGFPDALMIAGKYQIKPEAPFTPGCEVSGVVTEVASDVANLRPGNRVLTLVNHGALAEECIAVAASTLTLPADVDMATAAGLLINYGTTYHGLVQRANLQSGESLLVLGAAGGVGLAAIEIGKALGARVLAAASSDEKLALAQEHGADAVFNYTTTPIKTKVMEFTDGRGIDAIYDPVGGDYAEQGVRSMVWGGRYLVVGFAAGKIPAIPLNLALLKGCSLVGVFWGGHFHREPALHATNMQALFELLRTGKLRPHLTYLDGLERCAEALDLINGRRVTGKLVIKVAS